MDEHRLFVTAFKSKLGQLLARQRISGSWKPPVLAILTSKEAAKSPNVNRWNNEFLVVLSSVLAQIQLRSSSTNAKHEPCTPDHPVGLSSGNSKCRSYTVRDFLKDQQELTRHLVLRSVHLRTPLVNCPPIYSPPRHISVSAGLLVGSADEEPQHTPGSLPLHSRCFALAPSS